jgi:hypothetical protein
MNQLCELASSGFNISNVIRIAAVCIIFGGVILVLEKKKLLNTKWLLPVLVLGFCISGTTMQATAQSTTDCTSSVNNVGTNTSTNTPANGLLVDDNPAVRGVFDYFQTYPFPLIAYSARYVIINNDTAPGGDPFDFATLRLLGSNSVMDEGREKFLILDPNDQTLPLNPDALWEYDYEAQYDTNSNVWGWWSLELTCNISDNVNCTQPDLPGDNPVCANPGSNACWPSGKIKVSLKGGIPSNAYTIPYTVDTIGGDNLNTANVGIEIPSIPLAPSAIYAQDFPLGDCNLPGDGWQMFPFDMMPYITNYGGGTLLPATIDLNPDTPELDKSVTVINYHNSSTLTFTVDNTGALTLVNPSDLNIYFNNNLFQFTIMDSNGSISNIGTTFTSNWCG